MCEGEPKAETATLLPLQVPNRAHRLVPEQLDATNVDARDDRHRGPLIQAKEERPDEEHSDLSVAGDQSLFRNCRLPHELHIGEPLGLKQGFRNILGGLTDAQ